MALQLLRKISIYLRFKPFDTSTAEGLDRERNRVAILSMIANAGSKGAAMTLVMAGIAWTLPYLGQERFGAWMAILSISTILSFLDFGVGNALTNHVAKSTPFGQERVKSAITGGVLIVAATSLVVFCLLNLLHPMIPWDVLFKTESKQLLNEIELASRWFYLFFSLLLFSNAVIKAYAGLQRAHFANTLQMAFYAVSIIALYIASNQQAGISVLLALTLLPVCITGLVLCSFLYIEGYLNSQGMLKAVQDNAASVLSVGGLFFALQIAVIVGWGSDSMIISATLGLAAVAPFAIAQRIFQFVSQPFAILNAPFWPAYADARSKGNIQYINQLFRRSFFVSLIGGAAGVVFLALAGPTLIGLLSDQEISIDPAFIWLFALWVLFDITGNSLGMYLNGMGKVRIQVVIAAIFVVVVVPVKLFAAERFGINGLLFTNIAGYFLILMFPYLVLFKAGKLSNL